MMKHQFRNRRLGAIAARAARAGAVMALIPTLVSFSPGTLIKSADFNTNFTAITTAFNNTAVLTDVARTITVAHTFAADVLFADALYDIGKSAATRPRDGFFSRNLTVGGLLLLGTTVTAGATAGDAVLKNGNHLYAVNAAGVALLNVVALGGSNEVVLGSASSIISIGGPASLTSAAAGETVIPNAKWLRGTTIAGNDTAPLIRLNVSNNIELGAAQIVTIGPVNATGASGGDLVLANSKWLRGVNTASGSAIALISLQGADQVQIAPNSVVIIGNPASQTGAVAGEIVLASGKALRSTNAAGTTTRRLIDLSADVLYLGGDNQSPIALGSVGTAVGAAAGEVILKNGNSVRGVNAANTNTFGLIALNASDQVLVAGGGQTTVINGDLYTSGGGAVYFGGLVTSTNVGAKEIVLQNLKYLRGVSAAGNDTVRLIALGTSNQTVVGIDSVVTVGAPQSLAGAVAGELIIGNGLSLRGVNAAGTNTFGLIALNASDQVLLSPGAKDIRWGSTAVALGGGAAPTLGTIGGSGPGTAAQNEWLKVFNAAGQARYIPVWA